MDTTKQYIILGYNTIKGLEHIITKYIKQDIISILVNISDLFNVKIKVQYLLINYSDDEHHDVCTK